MRTGLLVIGASLLIAGCVQSQPGVNSTTPAHTAGTPVAVPEESSPGPPPAPKLCSSVITIRGML